MPNAIAEALRLYGDDFARMHGRYSQYGYVYSEPEMFYFARPCLSTRPADWVATKEADAWWVELAIGKGALRRLYEHAPFRLPLVGWQRGLNGREHARFYSFDRLKTLLLWEAHP